MRDLFERLKRDGLKVIEELVRDRAQETVQLEFKQKEFDKDGKLTPTDREHLGSTLSALANSAGGLLILGVRAAKDANGIDAAQKKVAVLNLARFHSDVVRAVGELLMPRYEGIEVLPIEEPATPGAGYLAIWVDRSDRRPHRSEVAGCKVYWKRAGDSSFQMEHYDIEDAFNRIAPAELKVALTGFSKPHASQLDGGRTRTTFNLAFSFINEGRISACAPYIWVDRFRGGIPAATLEGVQIEHGSTQVYGPRMVFAKSSQVLLHPGMSLLAFFFCIVVITGRDGKATIGGTRPHEAIAAFSYGFGCQDARMKTGTFELKGMLLSDLVDDALPHGELVRRIDQNCLRSVA